MMRFASPVTTLSLALTFSLNSHSAVPRPILPAPTKEERAQVFTHVVENTTTVEQLSLMAALAGATPESIRELKALVGSEAFPAVKLQNNELTVNGEGSAIIVDPENPGRVRYKNRTWLYDKAKTIDRNYLSLMKFMNASASTPSFSFIPSAHAASPTSKATKIAAAVFVVGVVVTGGAALLPAAIGSLIAGLGISVATVGATSTYLITHEKVSSDEVRKVLGGLATAKEISVQCDAKEALLVLTMPDGRKVRVKFTQQYESKDGDHKIAQISDEKSGKVRALAHWSGSGPFYNDMLKCNTNEKAKAVSEQMAKAVANLRKANEKPGAPKDASYVPSGENGAPASGGTVDPAQ